MQMQMQMQKERTKKNKRITIRIDSNKHRQIEEFAAYRNETLSSIVETAIDLYLTKDIKTESLVFASLENLRRKLDYVDKRLEILFNFYHFSLTTIIAGLPDLKNFEISEANAISKNALARRDAMFEGFKKQISSNPSAFERLLTDYVEQVNEE